MTIKLGVFTVLDSPESYLELYQDKKLKSHADFEKHIDNKIKAQIEFLRINGKGEDLKLNASKTLHSQKALNQSYQFQIWNLT